MVDYLKELFQRSRGSGGALTPRGIAVRLCVSVAASLIASLIYSTVSRPSSSHETQSSQSLIPQGPNSLLDGAASGTVSSISSLAPSTPESAVVVPVVVPTIVLTTSSTFELPTSVAPAQVFISPIASSPKEGLYLLNDILKPKDWSKFTGGTCPVFVSLVLKDEIRLFKWSNDRWIDYSELLEISDVGPPIRVTSVDVTHDGVLDFIFEFQSATSAGVRVGAVMAQKACAWHWLDIENGGAIRRTAPYLSHDMTFLTTVDPSTGQPQVVEYNELLDRLEVIP